MFGSKFGRRTRRVRVARSSRLSRRPITRRKSKPGQPVTVTVTLLPKQREQEKVSQSILALLAKMQIPTLSVSIQTAVAAQTAVAVPKKPRRKKVAQSASTMTIDELVVAADKVLAS